MRCVFSVIVSYNWFFLCICVLGVFSSWEVQGASNGSGKKCLSKCFERVWTHTWLWRLGEWWHLYSDKKTIMWLTAGILWIWAFFSLSYMHASDGNEELASPAFGLLFEDSPQKMSYTQQANKSYHCRRLTWLVNITNILTRNTMVHPEWLISRHFTICWLLTM